MDFLHDCAAFVFDMDGLLFDTERLSQRALYAAAAELHVPIAEGAFLELIGRRMGDIHQRLAVRVGGDALAARLIECSEKHYETFLAQGVPVKKGAEDLLMLLAERGKPCAVATSTRTVKAQRKLEMAGLRKYFHSVVGGDQVERGKPAPDIYIRAAAGLGVAPQHCGVFEDSEPGLRAAHSAGANVVWVPDLAPVDMETQKLAQARADSLHAVRNFLKRPR